MSSSEIAPRRPVGFATLTIVLGAIGLFASFELLTEYVRTLQLEDYIPNCNISVLVTCGPNMGSWQGSIFGFSNPIIGMSAFMAPIIVGVALIAGARFRAWFWWMYLAGLLGGFVFVCWLSYQSIFALGTLCPWCMVVWSVMIPLWWVSIFRVPASGVARVNARAQGLFQTLSSWSWVFIVVTYVIIAAVAQFQLDWFAEFARM